MNLNGKKLRIGEKKCYCIGIEQKFDKTFFWPMGEHEKNYMEGVFQTLNHKLAKNNALLIAFEVEDWNGELSPWEVVDDSGEEKSTGEGRPTGEEKSTGENRSMGKQEFSGKAGETLRWITDEAIPYLEKLRNREITAGNGDCDPKNIAGNGDCDRKNMAGSGMKVYIGGYSLAGLFSLWAFYETGIFSGVASCSGSLWYPGFMDYAKEMEQEVEKREKAFVYLSLGSREDKTKHPLRQQVKTCTESLYRSLEETDGIKVFFEWNPGNHFTEPEVRLIKGFRWLIEHCR